ncbi:hypothetical protein BKM31_14270 [[Actinomadura] parvosata subsp. kistnae]|uniref:Uncharacterized protein n=1 Tax=[Actinomadura] parvosata subsp. kistnae TaxID=1909395 RepID=A0A1U9ZWY2_9ACTN|nr:hypothetical protein [Nonomuraea sp. ATCC 55076]AQZ62471.1 hypothetical protein BKM31_14270 [Nonomuraea sp. ATCC 55076]
METGILHQAEQVLIGACMSGRNLRYWPEPESRTPDMDRFPYVVDDEEWARENGYGRAARKELERAAAPSRDYFHGLPEERRRAWLTAYHGDRAAVIEAELPVGGTVGHSANGCVAQAWQELYGDKARWFRASRVTRTLIQMRVGRTQAAPAYVAARQRWSACMKAAGITADTPLALRRQRLADQEAGAEARDRLVATAEARCAGSSGLSRTARDLDAANASALEAQYPAEYRNARDLREAALPRARALIRKTLTNQNSPDKEEPSS